MKSYVLTGPRGIGKTRIAPRLAASLGCTRVIDEWNGSQTLPAGTLAITNLLPKQIPAGLHVLHAESAEDLEKLISDAPR